MTVEAKRSHPGDGSGRDERNEEGIRVAGMFSFEIEFHRSEYRLARVTPQEHARFSGEQCSIGFQPVFIHTIKRCFSSRAKLCIKLRVRTLGYKQFRLDPSGERISYIDAENEHLGQQIN